jgi:hypothetical protein
MKAKLLKAFAHDGQVYQVGDEYEGTPLEIEILTRQGYCATPAPAPEPKPDPEPEPESKAKPEPKFKPPETHADPAKAASTHAPKHRPPAMEPNPHRVPPPKAGTSRRR